MWVWYREANGSLEPAAVTCRCQSAARLPATTSTAPVSARVDGLGLGMFLSYMVAGSIKAGRLKYVLEDFEVEPTPVQVVYPHSKLLSNKVRAFVDECVGTLRAQKSD
jgi:DNA-binding transcriptional LysR family regulator